MKKLGTDDKWGFRKREMMCEMGKEARHEVGAVCVRRTRASIKPYLYEDRQLRTGHRGTMCFPMGIGPNYPVRSTKYERQLTLPTLLLTRAGVISLT